MNDLIDNLGITNLDGEAAVSSLSVAKAFGKRHSDVLKRIRALDRHTDFCTRNFKPGTYRDRRGMPHPLVVMTYSGFLLWLTSLKGSKDVMRIAEAYLAAFEAMEERRRGAAGNEPRAGETAAPGDAAFKLEAAPGGLAQARGRLAELTADLGVTERDGRVVVSSLDVARSYEKEHYDVLKAIKNAECSIDFRDRNFTVSTIKVNMPHGGVREQPVYYMTRDGFLYLAFGFTGKKAAALREAYIEAFNAMEAALRERERSGMPPAALRELAAAATQITAAVTELARLTAELAGVTAAVARRQDDVERRCAALERRLQGSPQPRPETAQIPLFTEPRELLTEARKALDKPAREPLVPPDIETKRPYTGIGVRLRRLRQHLDRTPDELAAMIRMSGGAYKNVELGINRPSLLTLTKLREATGVSADWLLFGHGAMFGAERGVE